MKSILDSSFLTKREKLEICLNHSKYKLWKFINMANGLGKKSFSGIDIDGQIDEKIEEYESSKTDQYTVYVLKAASCNHDIYLTWDGFTGSYLNNAHYFATEKKAAEFLKSKNIENDYTIQSVSVFRVNCDIDNYDYILEQKNKECTKMGKLIKFIIGIIDSLRALQTCSTLYPIPFKRNKK